MNPSKDYKHADKMITTRSYSTPCKYKETWATLIQWHLDSGRIGPSNLQHASPSMYLCPVRRQKKYQMFVFLIKEDVSFGHYKMRLYMKQKDWGKKPKGFFDLKHQPEPVRTKRSEL